MITLEKVDDLFMGSIIKKVNDYIYLVPNHPAKMLLKEDFYTGFGYRFWHIHEKGYFQILRLYDHAEVLVKYVGQDESDIIANIFEERVGLYYPYMYAGSDQSNSELKQEFHDYCHQYAHIDRSFSAYDVSSYMKEVYIPSFLEGFVPKGEKFLSEFYSGCYSGHKMCFDENMGYLYVIPSTNRNICVFHIGDEKRKAFDNLLKIAEKDTLHIPWNW